MVELYSEMPRAALESLHNYMWDRQIMIERTLQSVRIMIGVPRNGRNPAPRQMVIETKTFLQNVFPKLFEYVKFVKQNPQLWQEPEDSVYSYFPFINHKDVCVFLLLFFCCLAVPDVQVWVLLLSLNL